MTIEMHDGPNEGLCGLVFCLHRSQLSALVLHLNSILDATSTQLWARRSEKWDNQTLIEIVRTCFLHRIIRRSR